MKHESPDHWKTVKDAEIAEWLARDGTDARELIVEAKLPARKVTVQKRADGRVVPDGKNGSAASDRAAVLAELHDFLAEKLDVPPVLLKAAGALAESYKPASPTICRASPSQIYPTQPQVTLMAAPHSPNVWGVASKGSYADVSWVSTAARPPRTSLDLNQIG